MKTCETKISVTICPESSTDAVAQLKAQGMGFNAACKLVANDYNERHKDDKDFKPTKWQTLRKQSQRADKAATTVDTVHSKKVITVDTVHSTKQKINDLLLEITKLKEENLFIIEQSGNIEKDYNEKFQRLFQDFNRAYNMLSPIQQAKFNDEDSVLTNKQLIAKNKQRQEEQVKKMRTLNGYNEDGTTMD